MVRIGICDDEKAVGYQLKEILENILQDINTEYEIFCYFSASDLLKNIANLNLIFLDIEMPEIDGISAGKEIHSLYADCKIVMATSRVERFKETFKFGAFRFVTKPFDREEIKEALESYEQQLIGREKISVYKDRVEYSIVQSKILYAEAYNGYTEFSIGNQRYRKECSLNVLEKVLDSRCFYRINKQYCVNLFYIQEYNKGKIKFASVESRVSRRKQKDFEKLYNEFQIVYR